MGWGGGLLAGAEAGVFRINLGFYCLWEWSTEFNSKQEKVKPLTWGRGYIVTDIRFDIHKRDRNLFGSRVAWVDLVKNPPSQGSLEVTHLADEQMGQSLISVRSESDSWQYLHLGPAW